MARTTEGYYFATRADTELAPWLSAKDMEEQQRTLNPADFARLWQFRWVEPAGSWITREMYDSCETGHESRHAHDGQTSVGFVDVGLVSDLSVAWSWVKREWPKSVGGDGGRDQSSGAGIRGTGAFGPGRTTSPPKVL